MNRPVRTRMQGGVGRAGEKLALIRLRRIIRELVRTMSDYIVNKIIHKSITL